jgi:hypothetical protein
VAGCGYVLEEGDAASFWCAERHGCEPPDALGPDDPSVLFLSVWVAAARYMDWAATPLKEQLKPGSQTINLEVAGAAGGP